jgi:hypothetical protein
VISGAVAVATVEPEVDATAPDEQSQPAPQGEAEGETPLTRAGAPVPKPRPKPDIQVVDESSEPDAPGGVDEPQAAPAAPTVIRPVAPRPVQDQTSTTSRDSYR